jgi:hypothetical protein
VCEFLLEDELGWNEDKLRLFLPEPDVCDILNIPVGREGSEDVLAWNHTRNGLFSVKSAYLLAVERKRLARGLAESSGGLSNHKGRMALWEAQVPRKIKVHMWRLIENGLAVGTELACRRIKVGVVCLACGRTEDLVHRFWVCPHSISAWSYLAEITGFIAPSPPKKMAHHSDLKGWLLDWIGKASVDHAAWFLMMS